MNDTDRIKRLRQQTEEFAQALGRIWSKEKAEQRAEIETLRAEIATLRDEIATLRDERSLRMVA